VIQVVGLILVIALLTIPPFIVEKYAKSLLQMMIGFSLAGALFAISGLYLSYTFDLTSGASIIMVAGADFSLSLLLDHILQHRRLLPRTTQPEPPNWIPENLLHVEKN